MIHFGTGGWRAVIGDEFTRRNIQILAKAISMKMKSENIQEEGIVIGYDRVSHVLCGKTWAALWNDGDSKP